MSDDAQIFTLIKTSIGTKFIIRWADLMCRLVLDAVRTVSANDAGVRTVDIKRYACAEKVSANVSALRRVCKSDDNCIARAIGATMARS